MSCKNIQELTPFQIWHFSSTFWKGVSPCMFLVCIYKDQEYTRTHTFSEKVWVPVCLTLIFPSHYFAITLWNVAAIANGSRITNFSCNNIVQCGLVHSGLRFRVLCWKLRKSTKGSYIGICRYMFVFTIFLLWFYETIDGFVMPNVISFLFFTKSFGIFW